MPLFLEAGVNAFLPFEVAAGNDVREVREKYPRLVIWGGIDKRNLLQSKDAVKGEIMEKVPPMWEKGGYIPCLDHSTMPCPQENWEYYLETLRGLFEEK
jgi:uroporphyrinogen decarboxylase